MSKIIKKKKQAQYCSDKKREKKKDNVYDAIMERRVMMPVNGREFRKSRQQKRPNEMKKAGKMR